MAAPATRRPDSALAHRALERALRQQGAARREQISDLSRRYPAYGPIWLALAEAHIEQRRREEAETAARKALSLDRSLASQFSSQLSSACSHLMPQRDLRAPSGNTPVPTDLRVNAMRHRIHNPGEPDIELAQAKRLNGFKRRERIEALTRRFPAHAPTWLALAEDCIAQRSVALAMESLERAVALDPTQKKFMSPKLETAYRFHDGDVPSAKPPIDTARKRPTSSTSHDRHASVSPAPPRPSMPIQTSGPNERTHYVRYEHISRPNRVHAKPAPAYLSGVEPRAAASSTPAPEYRARSHSARHPNIEKLLTHALELPNRHQRLEALYELLHLAPEHPALLFHVAMQCTMAHDIGEARRVAETLKRVDPDRYRQLYEWANEWSHSAPADASMRRASATQIYEKASPSAHTQRAHVPRSPSWLSTSSHKTQLLALPLPPVHRQPAHMRHASRSPHMSPISNTARTRVRPQSSKIRAAGALIAGVAAGLLVAMLLVFVVNSTDSAKPSHDSNDRTSIVRTR